jgi:hypothetical protein
MFSTVRVPGRESDQILHFEAHDSRHIVVVCKGSYYKLEVITEKGYVCVCVALHWKPVRLEV